MLHTNIEEKRARVCQMGLRTGWVRTKRTSPYVEILAKASTAADGMLWRERSGFYRCRDATLGLTLLTRSCHLIPQNLVFFSMFFSSG
jgi:hypothetical protein